MATTFNNSGKPTYMYDSVTDTWFAVGAKVDTAAGYTWTGAHVYSNTVNFNDAVVSPVGINNFLNPAARDAAIPTPTRGTICFVRQDAGGSALNQIQFYNGSAWTANDGDIKGVTAGTGLTGGGTAGTVTLNVDTSTIATVSSVTTVSTSVSDNYMLTLAGAI